MDHGTVNLDIVSTEARADAEALAHLINEKRAANVRAEIERRELDLQIFEMRVAGGTYRQIGDELSISQGRIASGYRRALAILQPIEGADEARRLENARMEHRMADLWRLLESAKVRNSPSQYARLSLTYLRYAESRRKMLGLDAPEKVEFSAPQQDDIIAEMMGFFGMAARERRLELEAEQRARAESIEVSFQDSEPV